MLSTGKFRHKIIIQALTETLSYGKVDSSTRAWTEETTAYADVLPQKGSEYWAAKQTMEKEPVIFVIRYQSGIEPDMRILFKTAQASYNILSVTNVEYRNKELMLVCETNEQTEFSYSSISVGADGTYAWTTDAYGDSRVRYRKQGDSLWNTLTTEDSSGVMSHTVETLVSRYIDYQTYEYQIKSVGYDNYTPGWSATNTFSRSGDILVF